MTVSVDDFFKANEGKTLNFDGYYGSECIDLVQFYNRDVVGAPVLKGNAIDVWTVYPTDFYEKIVNNWNDLNQFPQKGDVVIWNAGKFGHIAICSQADGRAFTSFDINWPIQGFTDKEGNFIGTGTAHFQQHTYAGVLGWLHPKNLPKASPVVQPQPQNVPLPPTLTPVLMVVTAPNGVNIRPQPSTMTKPVTSVVKGTTLSFGAIVVGETVDANNVWYRLTNGYYVWSGAVSLPAQGGK